MAGREPGAFLCCSTEEDLEEDGCELTGKARRRWTPNQLRARIRKLLQQTDIKFKCKQSKNKNWAHGG